MSQIPNKPKPKYNNDDKFAWVDSQLEKFIAEQKELKDKILVLEIENAELKDRLIDLGENPNQLPLF